MLVNLVLRTTGENLFLAPIGHVPEGLAAHEVTEGSLVRPLTGNQVRGVIRDIFPQYRPRVTWRRLERANHDVQQEGLEIFLRTMLTFTGKGLLFGIGLGAVSAWGFASAALTSGISLWTGIAINAYAVFTGGMISGLSLLAGLMLYGLGRTYRSMNPIEDIPR
jgi:hypothetical protein